MADEITKSIRRIVRGLEDDPIGLADADEYKSIGTSRGEAFINSRGDVTGSASEGSDDKEEKPSSTTPPTDNPDDNDTGGEGGTNTGADPEDALSGDVKDVDDAFDTATQIGTLTGTDPTTGTLMSLNLNTLEGIEYIPPIGWNGPDEPPAHLENDPDAYAACATAFGQTASFYKGGGTWVGDGGELRCYSSSGVFQGATGKAVPAATCASIGGDPDLGGFCDLVDPASTPHTVDGVCAVVFDIEEDGYKGHVRDPDCSAAQKLPTDFVIIRSVTDPTKFFRYTRLANGGTKITQVDSGGTPVPGTITKTTDEGGRVDGFFDVSLDAGIT